MSSKRYDDLSPEFEPLARQLVARCEAEGIPITVVETRRTEAEHAANLAHGVSWTKRSKHCDGLAIDIAPTELLKMKAWAPNSPKWEVIGKIGEGLGLRWGGRWKQKDCCHFEIVKANS